MAKKVSTPAVNSSEANTPVVEVDLTQEHQTPTNNDVTNVNTSETPTVKPVEEKQKVETVENTQEVQSAVIEEAKPEDKTQQEAENEMPMTPKELAKFAVGLVNVGLSATMPKLYLNAEFSENERELIARMQSGEDLEDTPENSQLMRRFMQYVKSLEAVALTDDETKMYEKNWQKCFEKWQLKMSPEAALITSSLIIVGGRLFPVITKKIQNIF